MNPRKEIYELINRITGLVTVLLNDEVVNQGSCFCFSENGQVITAAHVIANESILEKCDKDSSLRIFVNFQGMDRIEYRGIFSGISIDSGVLKEAIELDYALLVPNQKVDKTFQFITACKEPPSLGEELYIAGFSDELDPPFPLKDILIRGHHGVDEAFKAAEKNFDSWTNGPLIKRCTIGNTQTVGATIASNKKIELEIIYLDNGMHSGASGGPVVNERGQVVGVLTARATTVITQNEQDYLILPSGSSVALTLQPIDTVVGILNDSQQNI